MAILFISFLPTVIVATLIQTRVARQDGWSAIRKKPFLEMYWKNVTPLERFLFWRRTYHVLADYVWSDRLETGPVCSLSRDPSGVR